VLNIRPKKKGNEPVERHQPYLEAHALDDSSVTVAQRCTSRPSTASAAFRSEVA
jgi:hypothetical protein